jgi:hypothetical protein
MKKFNIGILIAALAFLVTPLLSYAASYAYVDNNGEVKSVTADTWQAALVNAPNIYIHSGVLLLDSTADYDVVDDDVRGF